MTLPSVTLVLESGHWFQRSEPNLAKSWCSHSGTTQLHSGSFLFWKHRSNSWRGERRGSRKLGLQLENRNSGCNNKSFLNQLMNWLMKSDIRKWCQFGGWLTCPPLAISTLHKQQPRQRYPVIKSCFWAFFSTALIWTASGRLCPSSQLKPNMPDKVGTKQGVKQGFRERWSKGNEYRLWGSSPRDHVLKPPPKKGQIILHSTAKALLSLYRSSRLSFLWSLS